MNQMMASAAIAISSVLGTEVEIGTPETKIFTEPPRGADVYPHDAARGAGRVHGLRRARAGSSSSSRTRSSCA